MVFQTGGIVFKFFKYRETSVIAKVFTSRFGLQTYIINGVRSGKKGRGRMALLQPLTLLDLVAYHRENSEIQRISEMRCAHPYASIPYDVRKSTMAIFLSEVLYKCVKEEGPSEELFHFLEQAMLLFDHLEDDYQNFHLQFLIRLSRFLGFGLDSSHAFRLGLADEEEDAMRQLSERSFGEPIPLGRSLRQTLLERIIDFYRQHVEGLGEIKSLSVLKEVF
ncbi:MAG: DNA repair protein RecO [Cyclobacteriaceae bacterium]